jgi:DNA-binding transcriptional MocR family regulator
MLMAGLVGRGGVLALEALSYPTMRQFADMLGVTLVGLPLDGEGIVPEAYEAACRAHSVKAVYALPTLQNPTTVTMGVERRQAIAEISRRHGVAIIEDDIYSLLGAGGPPPLSSYAPELSWYILATAKSIAAGLKVAYVVAPSRAEAERRFWPGMRATYWMCAPISAAIATRFIEGDGADRIIGAVAEETRARQALVAEKLAGADVRTRPDSLHVWLMLPERHQRRDFAERVRALGAGVSPADTYDFGASPVPNAIRFGTGRAAQREDFARGLDAIATVWQQG